MFVWAGNVHSFTDSDYTAAFDIVSREYIYNALRLTDFPERTIKIIKKVYANAKFQPLINNS